MSDTHFVLKRIGPRFALLGAVLGLLVAVAASALAQTLTTLYSFTGGADGGKPLASVILDKQGNLYGTTQSGGGNNCSGYGCGTVFQITASGTETVLYRFTGGADGAYPLARLVQDKHGNLYGTTYGGGAYGWGTVFMLTPSGTETVLHSFTAGLDGRNPYEGVVLDTQGNLYGTTPWGGGCDHGTLFELTPSGTETLLHRFSCQPSTVRSKDGLIPLSGLVLDTQGNLYGITRFGGAYWWGTVFKVTPAKKQWNTVLYNFTGGADGREPLSGVVFDAQGNLYGTTMEGGDTFDCSLGGCGIVFQITASGSEKVLYSFTGPPDGHWPGGGLALDAQGNLYGTTPYGGAYDYPGTVFMVTPTGTETVLHSFTGGADGDSPQDGVVLDAQGNLYGTTTYGGAYGLGTVFKLVP